VELFDVNNIFSVSPDPALFWEACRQTFLFQHAQNPVYRQWCDLAGIDPAAIKTPAEIPALPVSFFKTHRVTTTDFNPEMVFESSGTTQTHTSRHLVKEIGLYKKSFLKTFSLFYGDIRDWCILGLLPSYLERQHSSLVMMVDELIKLSGHPNSGFYLDQHEKLSQTLGELEQKQQKTWLIGVTFGLLDFTAAFPQKLKHTTVIETGGMKGRRKELTRTEVHQLLSEGFGVNKIHSEYGMTELFSQAYSKGDGRFTCPPWMKILIRDEEDPLSIKETGRGILQVIDLANRYSCSFIATDDIGIVYEDGSFEVWGRVDYSDVRGCSLLVEGN
jgi:hypothetical protein